MRTSFIVMILLLTTLLKAAPDSSDEQDSSDQERKLLSKQQVQKIIHKTKLGILSQDMTVYQHYVCSFAQAKAFFISMFIKFISQRWKCPPIVNQKSQLLGTMEISGPIKQFLRSYAEDFFKEQMTYLSQVQRKHSEHLVTVLAALKQHSNLWLLIQWIKCILYQYSQQIGISYEEYQQVLQQIKGHQLNHQENLLKKQLQEHYEEDNQLVQSALKDLKLKKQRMLKGIDGKILQSQKRDVKIMQSHTTSWGSKFNAEQQSIKDQTRDFLEYIMQSPQKINETRYKMDQSRRSLSTIQQQLRQRFTKILRQWFQRNQRQVQDVSSLDFSQVFTRFPCVLVDATTLVKWNQLQKYQVSVKAVRSHLSHFFIHWILIIWYTFQKIIYPLIQKSVEVAVQCLFQVFFKQYMSKFEYSTRRMQVLERQFKDWLQKSQFSKLFSTNSLQAQLLEREITFIRDNMFKLVQQARIKAFNRLAGVYGYGKQVVGLCRTALQNGYKLKKPQFQKIQPQKYFPCLSHLQWQLIKCKRRSLNQPLSSRVHQKPPFYQHGATLSLARLPLLSSSLSLPFSMSSLPQSQSRSGQLHKLKQLRDLLTSDPLFGKPKPLTKKQLDIIRNAEHTITEMSISDTKLLMQLRMSAAQQAQVTMTQYMQQVTRKKNQDDGGQTSGVVTVKRKNQESSDQSQDTSHSNKRKKKRRRNPNSPDIPSIDIGLQQLGSRGLSQQEKQRRRVEFCEHYDMDERQYQDQLDQYRQDQMQFGRSINSSYQLSRLPRIPILQSTRSEDSQTTQEQQQIQAQWVLLQALMCNVASSHVSQRRQQMENLQLDSCQQQWLVCQAVKKYRTRQEQKNERIQR